AQRAGAAAKDTASLIEDAVKKAADGGEIADRAGTALGGIVDSVKKVTDLVGEIAAASNEQAQGVDQVNTAVSQMDKVTQQNAANAEESAAAAEELAAHANGLNQIVMDLREVVKGGGADGAGSGERLKTPATKQQEKTRALPPRKHSAPDTERPHRKEQPRTNAGRDSEQKEERQKDYRENVIPLDDDFKDF
ncbi:MAG: methyl-accepting chemotaxis protein, partial [Candidatus Nitrospinota bacterium M3_3B_026]